MFSSSIRQIKFTRELSNEVGPSSDVMIFVWLWDEFDLLEDILG